MSDENSSGGFEVVDVSNKAPPAPVPVPEAPAKPRNFLLDLNRHGVTSTQEYSSEDARDYYFHYYDQRGYQVRARNRKAAPAVTQKPAQDAEQEASA